MANTENEYFNGNGKDESVEYEETDENNKEVIVVKNLIKTRICKDYPSIYVNPPSREIKKWFETRRI